MPMAAVFFAFTMSATTAAFFVFVMLMSSSAAVFMSATTMIVLFTSTEPQIDPGSRSAVIVRPHDPPVNGLAVRVVAREHAVAVDGLVTNAAAAVVATVVFRGGSGRNRKHRHQCDHSSSD